MASERVRAAAEQHVGDTRVPGLVALVARGDDVCAEALGRLGIGRGEVQRDSLFRIASITKPITAAVTMALVDDGAGGLVSTADDLLAFSRMLLGGGAPVLSAAAVRAMTSDQLSAEQKARGGLGPGFFEKLSWGFCQAVYPNGAFGWNGGFGTSWLVRPDEDLAVIVLTQRLFESPVPPPAHTDIQAAALETGKAM